MSEKSRVFLNFPTVVYMIINNKSQRNKAAVVGHEMLDAQPTV